MRLTELTIRGVGPFRDPTTLKLALPVTYLTGANDAGKTFALQAIGIACAPSPSISQGHVNDHYGASSKIPWDEDSSLTMDATFIQRSKWTGARTDTELPFDREIKTTFVLPPKVQRATRTVVRGDSQESGSAARSIRVLQLGAAPQIRDIFGIGDDNETERLLLSVATDGEFDQKAFARLNALQRSDLIERASERLNERIAARFPPSVRLRFRLRMYDPEKQRFHLGMADEKGGVIEFNRRGTGIRAIATLMVRMIGTAPASGPSMLLLDEPENSLHPDSQHALRRFIEQYAIDSDMQVVIATHSSAMINRTVPDSVRVVRRTAAAARNSLTSVFVNDPSHSNFELVRTSLGILPGDSLLYASLCVVVEGASECLAVPLLLSRLGHASVSGFESMDEVLREVHFLDGEGDSYEYFCRLAKAQQCAVVVFLDGDKRKKPHVTRAQEKHPDVPFVFLPDNSEIEEQVPREVYFAAVEEASGLPTGTLDVARFDRWVADRNSEERRKAFSKQVEDYFGQVHPTLALKKSHVMRCAAERVPIEQVRTEGLRELVEKVRASVRCGGYWNPPE